MNVLIQKLFQISWTYKLVFILFYSPFFIGWKCIKQNILKQNFLFSNTKCTYNLTYEKATLKMFHENRENFGKWKIDWDKRTGKEL